MTFECFNQLQFSVVDPFTQDNIPLDPIEPNRSFAEVTTKLAIFQDMKDELAHSKASDPLKVEIFKGSQKSCNKSIASNAIYDCCFSYSGLATHMGLAKCNADELALASLKEEGQCHYIGMKEEKVLDLVTTNYEHVFCCFPSKLARVFNEQARKQLGIRWGSAEQPNCQGLTVAQIQGLNFNRLDLKEAFAKDLQGLEKQYADKTKSLKDPAQAKAHLEAIKQRMREKLEENR